MCVSHGFPVEYGNSQQTGILQGVGAAARTVFLESNITATQSENQGVRDPDSRSPHCQKTDDRKRYVGLRVRLFRESSDSTEVAASTAALPDRTTDLED